VLVGAAASAGGIALATGGIELLKPHVPVLSLSGLYLFAVVPVAIVWGISYALVVALLSAFVFDFFFVPPLYSFEISDTRSWFALLVFVVIAVVVGELAARSRRRAFEAELLARVATSLLARGDVSGQFEEIAAEATRALGVARARIELGSGAPPGGGELEQPLVSGGRQVGRILVESGPGGTETVRRGLLSALASLLSIAIEHERLAEDAYRAEALRRSDAVKTAVIQAVSHDLRTPLATIETALGSLRDPTLVLAESDRAELLEAVTLEHARLKRLVENLLDLSRLQAGAADPAPELWTVDQLIADALDEVEGAERVNAVVPDELPLVRVDAVQIGRVLVNLVENALKFSSSASPVQLRANAVAGEVVIRVSNAGRAIPQDELTRIFEPFQRLAGERVRGAGLGLAIAKGFAEANGGRIWAESRPAQGVSFFVALPAAARPSLVPA
jgi:two-component system sensor histidine kinase KdpD